jgi:hypothetical protein
MNSPWLPVLGAACIAVPPWLAGCATAPVVEPAAPPAAVSATLRAAQRGHGPFASFALCEASQCPPPTPKAFAAKAAATGHGRDGLDGRAETFVAPVPERPP